MGTKNETGFSFMVQDPNEIIDLVKERSLDARW